MPAKRVRGRKKAQPRRSKKTSAAKKTRARRQTAPAVVQQYSSPPCLLPEMEGGALDEGNIRIKRVYDKPQREDGFRVLVDRLWPRGLRKEEAAVDLWARDLAPSDALRKWFGHDPKRWSGFQTRYRNELRKQTDALNALRERAAEGPVTLLYGARDRLL
ncbi:MAG TPA: DUF488 family protein, partial [Steroidobacteraceae bacterium]